MIGIKSELAIGIRNGGELSSRSENVEHDKNLMCRVGGCTLGEGASDGCHCGQQRDVN